MIDKTIKEYLLPYVVNAALRAGAAIMKVYNSDSECDVALKSDKTPITDADRAAHDAITETLGPTRIPILSEEGREMRYDERRSWELFWLVDPLDGTVEFLNHNDEFTVNIALMSKNRTIGSVIYVPCLEKLYIAVEGEGAILRRSVKPDANATFTYDEICRDWESLPLAKSPNTPPRVAVSRSHITPETYTYIDKIRLAHPDIEIVEQGSSYKFCMLAEGEVDYYIRTSTTYEWDTAAGDLILAEAGGTTSAIEGDEKLQYNKEQLENPWFKCHSALSPIS